MLTVGSPSFHERSMSAVFLGSFLDFLGLLSLKGLESVFLLRS